MQNISVRYSISTLKYFSEQILVALARNPLNMPVIFSGGIQECGLICTFVRAGLLKQLLQRTENKVYSYDKGTGFVILNNKDAIRKIEEQIGESVVSSTDPKFALLCKIQKHLAILRKQQKFETKTISNFILLILFHHACKES